MRISYFILGYRALAVPYFYYGVIFRVSVNPPGQFTVRTSGTTMARVEDAPEDSVYIDPSLSTRSKTRSTSRSRVCDLKKGDCAVQKPCKFSIVPLQATCARAMRVQIVVMRNAAGSIAIAWLTGTCYSLGNIFSSKSLRSQSRDELIVANSVWAGVTFCTAVLLSFLPLMTSLRFIKLSDNVPTLWFCLKRLVRASIMIFVWTTVSNLGFGYLVACLANLQPHTFKYKMECYLDNVSLLGCFAGISRAVKKIYYEETCQGHARLASKTHSLKTTLIPSSSRLTAVAPDPGSTTTAVCYRAPSYWRTYIQNISSAAPALLATGFVHGLSRQRIVDRETGVVTGFVVGSIVFKLAIQELAKYYIMRKHVLSTRAMCVIVGIPTVLIDTQTRIVLLGISNKRIAAMGSLAMALIEISLRVGKAKVVRWSISRREKNLLRKTAVSSRQSSTADGPRNVRPSLSAMHVEFEVWHRQVQVFHTAELTADMYAEYIAIGCSASILFFYCGNPHYSLLKQSEEEIDVVDWRTDKLCLLIFQLGVEIVVDYVSIVLEMTTGIQFDHIQNLDSFLAALFMVTTVMNMILSIGVYLS